MLTPDSDDLRALGVLEPRTSGAQDAATERALAWRDEGYWLLLPLMLLGLFAFRRGGIAAALVLCALLPLSQPAQAQDGSLWRRADQRRHARIEQGVQAYRNGDFAAAEHAFSGIDSAEALYNKGNALAKQGRYDEAIEAYDAALRKQPDMEDAIANRRAVDAARKQQQGKPNSQQQSPQNEPGKNQKKPGQDRQDPQDARPEQSDAGSAQSRQDEPSRPHDAKPQEAQQQAADAAQREKMEQAMRQPPQPGNAKPGEQTETPAQREKRQAIEAQLRRVPDDPGGLLRAKFRLEYERRMRESQ